MSERSNAEWQFYSQMESELAEHGEDDPCWLVSDTGAEFVNLQQEWLERNAHLLPPSPDEAVSCSEGHTYVPLDLKRGMYGDVCPYCSEMKGWEPDVAADAYVRPPTASYWGKGEK